jgi:ketosteroid isomerase-like protein
MANNVETVKKFWKLFAEVKCEQANNLMAKDAKIIWPCTGEIFEEKDKFIKANSEYPGRHKITVEKIISSGDAVVTVVKVSPVFEPGAVQRYFYATSFFGFRDGLISDITEYWSSVEDPPAWRLENKFAKKIQ